MESTDESQGPNRETRSNLEAVLLVDDDDMFLDTLDLWVRSLANTVLTAHSGAEAMDILSNHLIDAMVTDLMLPDTNGVDLMGRAKAIQPDLPVVILTSYGSVENAIEAIRAGAFDYLQKTAYPKTIQHTLRRLAKQRSLQKQVKLLQSALRTGTHQSDLVARSHQMRHVLEQIQLTSDSPASVLIEGPAGTGKEAVARAIHDQGPRANGPFVAVSCDSIGPKDQTTFLFTDASTQRSAIKRSSGGTLYLRHVHALGPDAQNRLLQFLQDHTVRDEDGLIVCRPDVRVVAGSEQDLSQAVAAGRFREELYYKLGVFHIQIRPLSERTMDILALADLFLKQVAIERNLDHKRRFHPRALALLMDYPWPGNVPELRAAVFEAALAAEREEIRPEHLPAVVRQGVEKTASFWKRSLKEVEREHIERVLAALDWNRTKAADVLGIRRMTLYNKIKEYGLTPP